MEKPIPPNPDTMTDEEFDKWLEAEFIWESEQIEKALFPDGKWWHYSFKPTGLEWW